MIKDLKKYNTLAIASIGMSVVLGFSIFCYYQMYNEGLKRVLFLLLMLFLPGILGYLAYKGKSWAKWALFIPLLFQFGPLHVVIAHFSTAPLYSTVYLSQQFFLLVAIVLFFIADKKSKE